VTEYEHLFTTLMLAPASDNTIRLSTFITSRLAHSLRKP
jgi:hypothetical protein